MTARDDNPAIHVVRLDSDGDPTFVCLGDESAPCHNYPGCDCEDWSGGHFVDDDMTTPAPGHENVPQPACWMEPWLNSGDMVETYTGGEHYLDPATLADHGDDVEADMKLWREGGVTVEWEGDYCTWDYAEVTQ